MHEGRLADKEIRQYNSAGWWISKCVCVCVGGEVGGGLEKDEWTDGQITEHGKQRQMGGEVAHEEKCLS